MRGLIPSQSQNERNTRMRARIRAGIDRPNYSQVQPTFNLDGFIRYVLEKNQ